MYAERLEICYKGEDYFDKIDPYWQGEFILIKYVTCKSGLSAEGIGDLLQERMILQTIDPQLTKRICAFEFVTRSLYAETFGVV